MRDMIVMTPPLGRVSWPEYAMSLAVTAATRSEDPYHKVGAALLRHDNTIAALGYNGAPSGVEIDWSDRDKRRGWVIHAESNALRYVRPGEVKLMATTMMPCEWCVLLAASYGIGAVVYRDELDPTVYNTDNVLVIAGTCGIDIHRLEEQE